MKKPCVGMIVGPTASGKTDVAISLADFIDLEVVSADSIQVYRGMDIGSAKPPMAERKGITHHMIDVVDIGDAQFSVSEYQRMAMDCIGDILKRGKYPLVVGGTGLYIHALTYPLDFTQTGPDIQFREALNQRESRDLYDQLRRKDPKSAERLHPNDKKRIIRALEVIHATGGPPAHDFLKLEDTSLSFEPRMIGLNMPREILYERINKRVDAMMEKGLLREVQSILKKGYAPDLPALQGLGYRQLIRHLKGDVTLDEAVEDIKRETRRFAKRQLTWFKRDKRIAWFDVTSDAFSIGAVKGVLEGESI